MLHIITKGLCEFGTKRFTSVKANIWFYKHLQIYLITHHLWISHHIGRINGQPIQSQFGEGVEKKYMRQPFPFYIDESDSNSLLTISWQASLTQS